MFLIGHINKEGSLAGPKILEHMVDTVLQFEGDRNHVYRILRTVKNRFGSAAEAHIKPPKRKAREIRIPRKNSSPGSFQPPPKMVKANRLIDINADRKQKKQKAQTNFTARLGSSTRQKNTLLPMSKRLWLTSTKFADDVSHKPF